MEPVTARPGRPTSQSSWWLAAVAVAFITAQLVLVAPGTGLGWDETIYVSQVGGNAPPAFFSAPRARGISYLVAPVAALTASTTVIRIYLALLSGGALFTCLWIWRKLLPIPVLACAGALLASLWIALYYGPSAMPNLWSALGALAAVGWFLRAVTGTGYHMPVIGVGVAVAVVTLMRPADGLWLALPLAASALLVPGWRRPVVCAVAVAGFLIGAAPWVIEAYTHYGGLAARLRRASEIQGGLGWHLAVDDQVRALDGRALCRPCDVPWKHPVTAVWWLALPVFAAGGVAAAVRAHRGPFAVLATGCAASLAAQYLFMIDYAAPRFLLPAYALLALAVAECLVFLLTGVRPALRPVTITLLALALAGHLAVQYRVLAHVVDGNRAMRENYTAIAAALHRLGVRPPCMVSGYQAIPIAYYAGCSSRQSSGHDASITPDGLTAAARRTPVAVVVAGDGAQPPGYARTWRPAALPPVRGWGAYRVYLSPTVVRPAKEQEAPR
ncbi:hypothetical protein [Streptomyces zinciresistens]|uniref:hypothetical protein n=1 Tax=Streptomyces zinciresistens TaxID=1073330 RepID=UPI000D0AA5CB|nr:hypothetical protein [Streptomyces zinciresistens]